ncbi:hypothetical protein Syun_030411 [Stephania yunnanensis]|uniref:NADP-dependent oxidoreductase domain-containing protein n=1 Tax=Stephania yunnanensis TaxID=152371 RepID=A0AAP0HKH2_9MAGN
MNISISEFAELLSFSTLQNPNGRSSSSRTPTEHNERVFEKVNEMARRKGCTASQLALAWVHHQGTDVCPIPGTTKIENLEQNIGALSVKLTHEEMSELESLASEDNVKGDRYRTDHLSITWKYTETPPLSSWKSH